MQYLNEKGVVMIFAVLLMIALTVLGISASMTTRTDVQISSNYRCAQEAFYAAEAGINRGKMILNTGATDTWDTELNNAVNNNVLLGSGNIGNNGAYTITVADNTDNNGSTPTVDEDAIIMLTADSTACTNSVKQIDMLVKNNATNISQKHYKEDNVGQATTEGGSAAGATRNIF